MLRIIAFSGLFLLLFSCKTTRQPAKPMESYYSALPEERISIINVPVRIQLRDLEQSLNEQLNGILYEDKDIKDGDKMMIRAEKREDIRLKVEGQRITYRVPLKLWIRYDLGITEVEANGDLALNLKTDYTIKNDWSLETVSDIENYEWLKRPTVRLGSVNLPIGFIADIVMKNSKRIITRAIDDAVRDNLNLRQLVADTWNKMFEPLLVAPEYNTWLLVNPQAIGMTPPRTSQDEIFSTIIIESRPQVTLGSRPIKIATPPPLPPLTLRDTLQSDFIIHIKTDVPYAEAERIAKAELVGETFSEGRRSVRIDDINLYGQGNKLIINTKLSGSYNGNVFLAGKPVYNASRNTIDVKDLDFTLETRNFLHKSAGWLLKGTLRRKIQENMNFLLDYNLKELRKQLHDQLEAYPITSGIMLRGGLDDLSIQDAFLAPDAIRVNIALRGRVNVQVSGLSY
jgi:hypothetical protein